MEQFESLILSSGPGGVEVVDTRTFPRPVGPEREVAMAPQPVFDPGNCSPDNMRPTVNGIPNSNALKARYGSPRSCGSHDVCCGLGGVGFWSSGTRSVRKQDANIFANTSVYSHLHCSVQFA